MTAASSPMRERVIVVNSRARVTVTVVVRVVDSGREAEDRWSIVQDHVKALVAAHVQADLKALEEAVKAAPVALRSRRSPYDEKDLDLNGVPSLHRLANDLTEALLDRHEGRVLPGQGEPPKLPGVDVFEVVRVAPFRETLIKDSPGG